MVIAGRLRVQGRTAQQRRRAALVYAVALAGSAFILLPVLFMVTTALKSDTDTFSLPLQLVPRAPVWSNFAKATSLIPFWRYMGNSLLIASVGSIGTVLSASIVAYALARLRAPGLGLIFTLVLATMILPLQVLLVTQFLIFKGLGWYGTYLPLIVPSWLGGGAFNIFLLRQFFLTLPVELEQAALVDGAGYVRIFWRIIVPQSIPALLAVGLLDFTSKWNDFLGPLIYLNTTDSYTLPLGLSFFQGFYQTQWNYFMAASSLAVVPCAVVFFIGQRLLVRGVVIAARRR